MNKLQEAKERVNIFQLWDRLNIPGQAKRVCNAPWREDKTPSLSISADGKLWKDFGEGTGGDVVCFLERFFGIDRKEACRRIIEMAGLAEAKTYEIPERPKPIESLRDRTRPELPLLTPGSPENHRRLAELRGIGIEAVERAVDAELLYFCTYEGHNCWLITDREKVNAQVRRLDGKPFGDRKAKTLFASWAKWPIGIGTAGEKIILTEGGPDLVAAFDNTVYKGSSPVCMFGAGMEIHAAAVPLFARKEVVIVPHNDDAGAKAAAQWGEQLSKVCNVSIYKIPSDFGDLNDLVTHKRKQLSAAPETSGAAR